MGAVQDRPTTRPMRKRINTTFSHRSLTLTRPSRMPWNRERKKRSKGVGIAATLMTRIIPRARPETRLLQVMALRKKVKLSRKRKRRRKWSRLRTTTVVSPIRNSSNLHSSKNKRNKINNRKISRIRDRTRLWDRLIRIPRGKIRGYEALGT